MSNKGKRGLPCSTCGGERNSLSKPGECQRCYYYRVRHHCQYVDRGEQWCPRVLALAKRAEAGLPLFAAGLPDRAFSTLLALPKRCQ